MGAWRLNRLRLNPMWMLILNVVYVLVAIAIIALVLMQRGSGAHCGSRTRP